MQFDYSKLLGRIREFGFTQETLAEKIGISSCTLNVKLKNKSGFSQREIRLICEALLIDSREIGVYFFAEKTRKTEQTLEE